MSTREIIEALMQQFERTPGSELQSAIEDLAKMFGYKISYRRGRIMELV